MALLDDAIGSCYPMMQLKSLNWAGIYANYESRLSSGGPTRADGR